MKVKSEIVEGWSVKYIKGEYPRYEARNNFGSDVVLTVFKDYRWTGHTYSWGATYYAPGSEGSNFKIAANGPIFMNTGDLSSLENVVTTLLHRLGAEES